MMRSPSSGWLLARAGRELAGRRPALPPGASQRLGQADECLAAGRTAALVGAEIVEVSSAASAESGLEPVGARVGDRVDPVQVVARGGVALEPGERAPLQQVRR